MFATRLFGKRIQNKYKQNDTDQNIHVSNTPPPPPQPPSRNAKIQKLMAKHVVECFKKEKRKTAKNVDSKTQLVNNLIRNKT